ncbi:MAG TPA: hypothetical protein VER96_26195 [Polyangiaceae bacterium]|nr:hypothetical protein [Polyangiaceae bacterium]
MAKQTWLLLVTALGLGAVQACSDSDNPTYPPASAGSGGRAGAGGHSAAAGHAGTQAVAGSTNGEAGESPSDAGAGGEAEPGNAGAMNGGSGGNTPNAGSGGTATSAGSGGTATNAGSGGTSPNAGSGGTATNGGSGGTSPNAGNGGVGGSGGTSPSGGSAGVGGAGTTFTLQTTTLGQVISTASGRSLYVFNTDTAANGATPPVSTCSGGCLGNWPVYYGNPVSVPPGLSASDFSSFDRGSGVMQSTYKGWPLYTYYQDNAVGDVIGEDLGPHKWYTVKLPFTTPGATTFTLQTTTLGKVISTATGHSLYFFKSDTVGTSSTPPTSACTAGCLGTWPIYYGNPISVPLGLLASDFGSFDRGSGVMQSTYKGWPLYTYTPDNAVGDVIGEDVGHLWYTAKSPFVVP